MLYSVVEVRIRSYESTEEGGLASEVVCIVRRGDILISLLTFLETCLQFLSLCHHRLPQDAHPPLIHQNPTRPFRAPHTVLSSNSVNRKRMVARVLYIQFSICLVCHFICLTLPNQSVVSLRMRAAPLSLSLFSVIPVILPCVF